ncbi:MAG: hypothetical protein Terrestrivirus6_10 [Terrestrivirus sp.]|uniref:Uncharacterized protein n=1 Tax=Terrestrivirus sp. TaxID=2487775 RepID=A0A3G4ZPX0_9VIRU|nr:MAG: hypothetical protein Terrestrivirus6_10 [Terrestrivirus sp.]
MNLNVKIFEFIKEKVFQVNNFIRHKPLGNNKDYNGCI